MKDHFTVDGNTLTAHISSPPQPPSGRSHGVVIAHGFPTERGGGIHSSVTMPTLADRVAAETGFASLVFASRGMQTSEGDFSLDGWRRDLAGAVDLLIERTACNDVWLIGFGTGGALAVIVAQADERVKGVATAAAPADFDDWARHPRKLLVWSREVGVVRDQEFPASLDAWAGQLRKLKAVDTAALLNGKELLVLHGSDDQTVPVQDARDIAAAYPKADLRIISGADHHLRHDPRALAMLTGWMERQKQTKPPR